MSESEFDDNTGESEVDYDDVFDESGYTESDDFLDDGINDGSLYSSLEDDDEPDDELDDELEDDE